MGYSGLSIGLRFRAWGLGGLDVCLGGLNAPELGSFNGFRKRGRTGLPFRFSAGVTLERFYNVGA